MGIRSFHAFLIQQRTTEIEKQTSVREIYIPPFLYRMTDLFSMFLILTAMTYLFGGFTNEFYDGYESEWALPAGHEKRRTVYNLYHILNHEVLFGGGYRSQARGMIEQILRM